MLVGNVFSISQTACEQPPFAPGKAKSSAVYLPLGSVSMATSSSSSDTSERPDVPAGLARLSPDAMFAILFDRSVSQVGNRKI